MSASKPPDPPRRGPPLAAIQTSWGTIRRLFVADSTERAAAWREFHQTYRPAIVAYVRRFLRRGLGHDPGEELAEEVAQAFIVESFEKGSLSRADPAKGRFRAYLQGALHHYCCNWLDYRNAQRRNPPPGSRLLDVSRLAEAGAEPAASPDAVEAFDQAWAATILGQAIAALRRTDPESAARIDDLTSEPGPAGGARPPLTSTERSRRHRAVERLRAQFATLLAQTVSRDELRNDEWQALSRYLPADLRDPTQKGSGPPPAR